MKDFSGVLDAVHNLIVNACTAHGRSARSVRLLAVSKQHPASAIRALANGGQRAFGESYVSEALGKIAELNDLDLEWHFIGPIQSNKTASIATHFDWVHSVDREKVLRRLSAQRPDHAQPLNCCLQVKIGDEKRKSGMPAQDAEGLARLAQQLPNIRLRGLMTVPPPSADPDQQRRWFSQLGRLQTALADAGIETDTLSMGMSDDLEAAIAEGATIVRVGTALFGPRPQKKEQP